MENLQAPSAIPICQFLLLATEQNVLTCKTEYMVLKWQMQDTKKV